MRQRHHRAVAIQVHPAHHVVGHAAVERHAGDVPARGVLLARIHHGDVVIQHVRHFGEVLRKLPGADQHQAPARAVHRGERLAVELEHVLPAAGLLRHLAGGHVQAPAHQLLLADGGEQRLDAAFLRDRLQHQLQGAAAGQAPARRFLVGHPIGHPLRQVGSLRLYLFDQVILDAAAGDRAHHLAVVADHDQRAHRARG